MQNFHAIGRLTRAPKLVYSGEKPRCEMVLAVEDRERNRTDFFPIVAWHQQAINCANYLVKGQEVSIYGKWRSSNYKKDGQPMIKFEVEITEIKFLQAPKQAN
ncbi:single-stranded DNA-binding protein [Bacillus sp. FJAT-29937]|uniref:single-stranded DNA-binding protein n=1 Tax=Bacillus sp. FJAT-29937 TaxID=1720553 RepID=UPI000835A8EC|nr:single-stranded DNA-binding protein [Bacillus sp. FJAT-29937]